MPDLSPTHKQWRPCALAVLLTIALLPVSSHAFQIRGRVINGTTDTPVKDATVIVVNPSGGMMVENQVEILDDQGSFIIDDLDRSMPVYLVRVTYKDVNYTEMVQFNGEDPYTMEIKIYEPTESWDGVHVSVPHFIVTRHQDTLSVNKFYQIANHSSPAKTLTTPFPVYVPEDVLVLNSCTVMSLGMPLDRTLVPTEEAGFYTVSYPFKPGSTQLSVSMGLPYHGETYTYNEPLKYDIDELVILVNDPSLQITRDGQPVAKTEEFRGFSGFRLADLEQGTTLSLTFAGGDAAVSEAPHTVLVVPNETHRVSVALMVALTLALLGLIGFVAGKPRSGKIEREVLTAHRNKLLDQLARLDDLYKMGTLSEQIYTIKRAELVGDLAQVYYRSKFDGGPPGKKRKQRKKTAKGAARV